MTGLMVRFNDDYEKLLAEIRTLAKQDNRTMNAEIITLLQEAVRRRGHGPICPKCGYGNLSLGWNNDHSHITFASCKICNWEYRFTSDEKK